jgi:hypothetical protein
LAISLSVKARESRNNGFAIVRSSKNAVLFIDPKYTKDIVVASYQICDAKLIVYTWGIFNRSQVYLNLRQENIFMRNAILALQGGTVQSSECFIANLNLFFLL